MKKILIAYSSRTGNTEKIAEVLHSVNPQICDIKKITEVNTVDMYEIVFVGYWVDKGEPDEKVKQFLTNIKNKKVVLFQTLGADPDSEHAVTSIANAAKYLGNSCKILGTLSIRGAIDKNLIEMMLKTLPEDVAIEERRKRWNEASTHPDENDLKTAINYMQNFYNRYK